MSEPFGGHEANVAYISESAYGQTPTSPAMVAITTATDVEPQVSPGLIEVRGVGSRDPAFIRQGLRQVDLKIGYALQNTQFFANALTLGSLSVEVYYEKPGGVVSLLHKGCIVDKATVECRTEDLVKATVDLVGQDLAVGTAKAGASYTPFAEAPVAFYESYVKKQVTTLERATAWKFTVENNLKRVPVIRSPSGGTGVLLKYLAERHRKISGELEFEFETKEEFDDAVGDTAFTLEIGLGGSSKATLSNCKWEKVAAPTKTEDLVACKAAFIAQTIAIT